MIFPNKILLVRSVRTGTGFLSTQKQRGLRRNRNKVGVPETLFGRLHWQLAYVVRVAPVLQKVESHQGLLGKAALPLKTQRALDR
jgi:hypothetical protein